MLTDEQIKHMVNRFLGWRLPEDFYPDGGVSFKRTYNDHMPTPGKYEPIGTNLLTATQAEAMVRHMLTGMPEPNHEDAPNKEFLAGYREGYLDADNGRESAYGLEGA